MERSSWTVKLSSSNKILVNIYFSDKNTLQKTVFGCPCFVSLLGPGKVSFETLTPKRAKGVGLRSEPGGGKEQKLWHRTEPSLWGG